MSKYNELISKIASEIVDERVEELETEKTAATANNQEGTEKVAEEDFDPVLDKIAEYQAMYQEELEKKAKIEEPKIEEKQKVQEKCAAYLEHAGMLKQAAMEAYAEAELFEAAANEVLEEYK